MANQEFNAFNTKMRFWVERLLIFFFILAVSGAEQNAQWKGKMEDKEGVKVINNPKNPVYGELIFKLEEDMKIGKEEEVSVAIRGTQTSVTREIKGNTDLQETDMCSLEIFDIDGILLGEIPLSHFVDKIFIKKDNLFLLDQMRGVKYYLTNIPS